MGLSGFPALVLQENVLFLPYNKSFIDQTRSIKMAVYWPRSSYIFIDLDFVSDNKSETQKRTWPIGSLSNENEDGYKNVTNVISGLTGLCVYLL